MERDGQQVGISDLIASFLQESLEEAENGVLEVQRNDLAQRFNCVPSQINYVMSTRFSMLITFLNMEPYMAVGIALASDVLASAVSAWTYKKNGNLDVKNGLVMMVTVLCFTLVGS